MALTIRDLEKLLSREGMKFFRAPDKPVFLLLAAGPGGLFQIAVSVQDDGEFLQFRTLGYMDLPSDHRHLRETLTLLAKVNYDLRQLKFSWNPEDGEIAVYADHIVMDNKVTQQQFHRTMSLFLVGIDAHYTRIKSVMDKGVSVEDGVKEI